MTVVVIIITFVPVAPQEQNQGSDVFTTALKNDNTEVGIALVPLHKMPV